MQQEKADESEEEPVPPPIIPRSRTPPPTGDDNDNNSKERKQSFSDAFFKDFAAGMSAPEEEQSENSPSNDKSHKKGKHVSKLDLAAFARHLHENRLSVMQLRQNNIELTEDDERELMRLVEKRKTMMAENNNKKGAADVDVNAEKDKMTTMMPKPTATETPPALSSSPLPTTSQSSSVPPRPLDKKPSLLLQKLTRSNSTDLHPGTRKNATNSVSVSSAKAPNAPHWPPFSRPSASSSRTSTQETERRKQVRKSMSMDDIRLIAQEKTLVEDVNEEEVQQHMKRSTGMPMETIAENDVSPSTSTPRNEQRSPKPTSSRSRGIGLFGSLRQASRSQTSLRGLVRNLSNAGHYRHSQQQQQRQQKRDQEEGGGNKLSPAAMAVMKHASKQQQKSEQHQCQDQDQTKLENGAKSNNNSNKGTEKDENMESSTAGGNLISHLLARATKPRRTKTVNMQDEQEETGAASRKQRTKSRVVRRTIIYVPPDSINFMKTISQQQQGKFEAAPPLPAESLQRIRDLQSKEKEKNAASKKPDEVQVSSSSSTPSADHYYDDDSLYDYYRSSIPDLEGLEVREMEDGTIEWGIVKKEGNRKSFYIQDKKTSAFQYVEEEDIEPLPSPPPIPRRSPRRQIDSQIQQQKKQQQQQQQNSSSLSMDPRRARHISTITSRKDLSTTDVYYAPQQTLPSLLQMIADAAENDQRESKKISVEEQLDEMMRSIQDSENFAHGRQ